MKKLFLFLLTLVSLTSFSQGYKDGKLLKIDTSYYKPARDWYQIVLHTDGSPYYWTGTYWKAYATGSSLPSTADLGGRFLTNNGTTANWSSIDLSTNVTGNLPIGRLNGGSGASSSTFWRGDGTWATAGSPFASDITVNSITVGRGLANVNGNTTFGASALNNSSAGVGNTAIGYSASSSTTGIGNTAVGYLALYLNNSGTTNTAVGRSAMQNGSTGSTNVAVGYSALSGSNTADGNTALGSNTLAANTSGAYNTAIGYGALQSNTTATANTAVGKNALGNTSTGYGNTAVGFTALISNASGRNNTAIGDSALYTNATGNGSIGVGAFAGYYSTAGNEFYVANVKHSNLANGRLYSLMWGTLSGTVDSKSGQQLTVNGSLVADKFFLSANNTAPSSASDTGTAGEIRITNGYLYYAPATNTWLRVALTTW